MTPARQKLHTIAAGHPQAIQGLREYQAIAEAAVALVNYPGWFGDMPAEAVALVKALKAGGRIK